MDRSGNLYELFASALAASLCLESKYGLCKDPKMALSAISLRGLSSRAFVDTLSGKKRSLVFSVQSLHGHPESHRAMVFTSGLRPVGPVSGLLSEKGLPGSENLLNPMVL